MRILTPSLLLLSFFVLGGMVFKSMTPTKCNTLLPNDNIFVLTGDIRRIPFAMRKLHQYPDANLYIIGAGIQGSYEMAKKVKIESESKSTYENALAIKEIAKRNRLNRVVIITTEDHMNRALYLIKNELPESEVVACTVPLTGMPVTKRLERWFIEYIKYIVTIFGIKEG